MKECKNALMAAKLLNECVVLLMRYHCLRNDECIQLARSKFSEYRLLGGSKYKTFREFCIFMDINEEDK